jgi:hypothetical protein
VSTLPSPGPPISPAPLDPTPPRRGCARGALIGCGAAALLVLACFGAFLYYARRKPEVFTDLMMGQIERHFASDVTAEDKDRLRAAYARFRAKLEAKEIPRDALEPLRGTLNVSASGEIGREKVRELTRVFEEAAGPPARPSPSGSPGPSPAFSPTP